MTWCADTLTNDCTVGRAMVHGVL